MRGQADSEDGAPPRVWVVGNASELVGRCVASLEQAGLGVGVFEARSRSLRETLGPRPDLFVVEHDPPSVDGIGWLRQLRVHSGRPVIIVSGVASIPACEAAMRRGANRFLLEHDLARLGEIARGLLVLAGPGSEEIRSVETAADARELRDRELCERLRRLLSTTRGNIAEMARQMGKDRSTVRYHLQRFGMLRNPAQGKNGGLPSDPAQSS